MTEEAENTAAVNAAATLKAIMARGLAGKFQKTETVSVNPASQKLAGALSQAKREQQQGNFDQNRQISFAKYLLKQDWSVKNLPAQFWKDLFAVIQNILLTIWMATQFKAGSAEQDSIRFHFTQVIFEVISQDPSRVSYLSISDEQQISALGLTKLIQSGDNEKITLGVNMVQLLLFHTEGLTLQELIKFDISARDIIHKRESKKIWDAINQLGNQLMNIPDQNAQENIKTLMAPFVDERIARDLESANAAISKRLTAFTQEKIKEVNAKAEQQHKKINEVSELLKTLEGDFNRERSVVQSQVKALSEGKAISEVDLKSIGDMQAEVDAR